MPRFGQVLTAVGTLLQRAHRKPEAADLREVHEIVQATLEKVRALSQALHCSPDWPLSKLRTQSLKTRDGKPAQRLA